jgi:hypothetical protein
LIVGSKKRRKIAKNIKKSEKGLAKREKVV